MNPNTMPLEAETRVLIDRSLENLGWKLSGKDQNVYYEQPRSEAEKKKLCGKRPDYVLYSKDSDKPLIVIEAKKKGVRLDSALEQGIQYAKAIEAPLVFATDGVFCKAFHTVANRPPILNGEEIDEFIREALALRYLTSYEVNTVSPKVQYDRKELIRIFDEANNMLRGEGLRAGIERFGEFANILFLKLISESEQIKRESGIPTKFEVACSWDSIKQIPISTRIEYINKTVYDKLNLLYDTDIFTPLQIRDASILKEIMDKLDPLMLTDVDSDVKGDAFEYFLKASTSTKNDLGEYFTPRHIVKTMVRLVNPQIGEKIYDPFCGTGGFLIESFRYIHNNMARTEANMKTLRESTVYGNEITNTARITKMNMILAGDGHSNIKMLDSLANPIDGTETYMENGVLHHRGFDIVLANMPYSQKTKHGNLYDLPSTNGDSICVQHCMKAINSAAENGRMALVVPEGFLFRKDLTKTREYLLGHCQLQSIISLPQGVFLPYTGVKTDIIYATKVNKKVKSSEKKKDFEIRVASISAGLCMCTKGDSFDECSSKADKALYYVKQNGKHNFFFYQQMGNTVFPVSSVAKDLSLVAKVLRNSGNYSGALNLNYREFSKIYEYINQLGERHKYHCFLVMVTMETAPDSMMYIENIEQALEYMGEAIRHKIRRIDVCTRYSALQYLIILFESDESQIPKVMDRIFIQYYKLYDKRDFIPKYEYLPVNEHSEETNPQNTSDHLNQDIHPV